MQDTTASGSTLCAGSSGLGCAAGLLMGAYGTDSVSSGIQTTVSGKPTTTIGAQLLEKLGVPGEYSELAYSVTMAGGSGILALKSAKTGEELLVNIAPNGKVIGTPKPPKTIEPEPGNGGGKIDINVNAGSKRNWDRAINGDLEANARYHLSNGHEYITDNTGRVTTVEGKLSLTTMDRNTYQQCTMGKCGNPGDDGGHLIASSLGGAGDRINIVLQSRTLNRQDWKRMENSLRSDINAGKDVSVKIDVGYPNGGGIRPGSFRVTAIVDGVPKTYTFKQ
ncbi:DNA/RNA non-specific endonuclease [Carnimonas bestiolae]|uniref:DNA/RNA non-specific endonuclease n=1 Tax=Carnimonas bestiolae TaxID=3402172 RepID=UPI003F4AF4EA